MNLTRRRLLQMIQAGAATLAVGNLAGSKNGTQLALGSAEAGEKNGALPTSVVVADPTKIPPPISRDHAIHHDVEITARELTAEVGPGTFADCMTFNGQIPGPMIRVRQGDTISLTLKNHPDNENPHTIDLHAVYGPGGGAAVTKVLAGQSKTFTFKATFPGALAYHCAAPNEIDRHMSFGMFGMILVEPPEGLPKVDREFYLGQSELYLEGGFGKKGKCIINAAALGREEPSHVLFNGGVMALTGAKACKAKVGETVRVYLVNGGPNLTSSFHPIGNIWLRAWPQGAIANQPLRYVQTFPVCPGSTFVGDMHLPVPGTILLVDHAISRLLAHGALATMDVTGPENPKIFKA